MRSLSRSRKEGRSIIGGVRLFIVSAFILLPACSLAAERIASFHSDITVEADGTFVVTEHIEYAFEGEKHGIFREIPLAHPEKPSSFIRRRVIDVTLIDVRMDGESVPYVDESSRNLFKIRIGDADRTIEGTHAYTITYEVSGGLSYPQGEPPELYFNVTGNGWDVPILVAEAVVHGASDMLRPERACYRGFEDARGSCAISLEEDGSVSFSITSPLQSGEGMTIAQALTHTEVAKNVHEEFRTAFLAIPLTLLLIAWAAWRTYRYKVEHRTGAPIIAQYEPYPGVKPMYAGLLLDRRLDPHDITAGIVYLAREGFLKIRHTERKVLFVFEVDDYELVLLRHIRDLAGAFEEALLVMLFGSREAETGKTISLQDLKNDHAEARENYKLIQELRARLAHDLKTEGFVAGFNFATLLNVPFIAGLLLMFALLSFLSMTSLVLLAIALGILFLIALDGRRTQKGYEALDHLRGFKLFLSVTEKERYTFHNAPTRNAEQFMEYLPYAIAFGVEKEWAEVFSGITIPAPSWYEGTGSMHAWSAISMTESLGAFSSALAASGTSASSGGGSSGGGSGGGGGGSW